MFDVGFWEICLVGLVSLVVIGPEKLPKVARISGFWLGKMRSTVASVKEEIKQELEAEEMRQLLKKNTDEFRKINTLVEDNLSQITHPSSSISKQSQKPSTQPDEPKQS